MTTALYPLGTAVAAGVDGAPTDVTTLELLGVGAGATVDPPLLEHAAITSATNEPSTRRRRTGAR
jgi:hypothetical protein